MLKDTFDISVNNNDTYILQCHAENVNENYNLIPVQVDKTTTAKKVLVDKEDKDDEDDEDDEDEYDEDNADNADKTSETSTSSTTTKGKIWHKDLCTLRSSPTIHFASLTHTHFAHHFDHLLHLTH